MLIRRIFPSVLSKFFNEEAKFSNERLRLQKQKEDDAKSTRTFYKSLIANAMQEACQICDYRQEIGSVLGSEASEKLLADLLISWTNYRGSLGQARQSSSQAQS